MEVARQGLSGRENDRDATAEGRPPGRRQAAVGEEGALQEAHAAAHEEAPEEPLRDVVAYLLCAISSPQ